MRIRELSHFYQAIREDNRILPSHISVFMALFEFWNKNDFQNPVVVLRREVMAAAKINGLATYHRCMADLDKYGYIDYRPSFNPAKPSEVVMH